MIKVDVLRKSCLGHNSINVGSLELINSFEKMLQSDVPYMLAPKFDPATGQLLCVRLERAEAKSFDMNEFDAAMDRMAKEIEEDAWIVIQYRIGSISAGEAHAQRDALHEKRRAKIREEERARAKAELIEFMESL